jgi:hypothetical protein
MDFLLKSGRALMVPIYKGTYERRESVPPWEQPPALYRDQMIMWSKDLGRTLDYLEMRQDIDSMKLAYLLLGTPDKDKRHVIYDAGHGNLPRRQEVRESLDWLDRYLGPVKE